MQSRKLSITILLFLSIEKKDHPGNVIVEALVRKLSRSLSSMQNTDAVDHCTVGMLY
jgi:hypothetical protein